MKLAFVKVIDPDEAPEAIGQFWINTATKGAWIATGLNLADWLPLNTPVLTKIYNQTTSTYQPIVLEGEEGAAQIIAGPST